MRHIYVSAAALLAALGVTAASAQQGGPPDKGGGGPAVQSPGGAGGGGMGKGSGPGPGAGSAEPRGGSQKSDAGPPSSSGGGKQSDAGSPPSGKSSGKSSSSADVKDAPGKAKSGSAQNAEPKADGKSSAQTDTKSGTKGKAGEPSKKAAEAKDQPSAKDSKTGTADSKSGSAVTKSGSADTKSGSASTGAATTGTDKAGRTKDGAPGKDRAATKAGADAVARLPDKQRVEVRERFRSNREARVTNVNFQVSIGTRVPRSVRLYAVPASVIAVLPAYRSYRYIIVDERICIIDPATYEIVYIVDDGPSRGARAALELSAEERRIILSSIPEDRLRRKVDIRFSTGVAVPVAVELVEFPDRVVSEVPELRSYRYVAGDGHVAVVDPANRTALVIID